MSNFDANNTSVSKKDVTDEKTSATGPIYLILVEKNAPNFRTLQILKSAVNPYKWQE